MAQLGPRDTCPDCGEIRGYFHDLPNQCRGKQPVRLAVAPVTPLDPERATRYAHKALTSEAENVAVAVEGTRNHALNKAAFNLSQLVAAGHLLEDDVRSTLTDAARSAGLDDIEIEPTIASGFKAGSTQPRVVPEPTVNGQIPPVVVLDASGGTEDDDGPPINPIIDWHELFTGEDDEEWILEPLLPARRMIALYSAPKAGKSLLMLEIAVALATGRKVLGSDPDRPHRVLYVDFENDPRGDVRTRLEAMDVAPADLGDLCYLTFPSLAKFDTAQGALDLLRHVEHYDCDVVVIDTVSRAVMGEENENDTWLAFYRHTGLMLKQHGIACIRLDHSGKDAEKGMRGGSAKYGDVDAVWRLRAVGEDTVVLECTDHRMPVPVKSLTLTREEMPLVHRVAGEGYAAIADAKVRAIDERLDALGVPASASVREALAALRGAGERVGRTPLTEAVRLRKLRLDIPSDGVPGTPPEHPGTAGGSVPGAPPPKGGAGTPPVTVPEHPGFDPDELVRCKSCLKPTTQAVAERNDGRCATCQRATGQTQEDA